MDSFRKDEFSFDENWTFEKIDEKIDGSAIRCRVRGPMFVPGGTSRNNRFYSRQLWEKQLSRPEIQKKISDRRMFGTIGHEQPIDDEAVREGKISHIVTSLSIEGDLGIGQVDILDTPAGRILETFMRAKAKLFTSSRARGKYKGENNGIPCVDEDTYDLKTFDFVIEPGFLEAQPKLMEELKKIIDFTEGDNTMDQAFVEGLTKKAHKLEEQLSGAAKEIEELKSKNAVSESKLAEISESVKELKEIKEELESYKKLGSKEDIEKAISTVSEYEKFGTVEEVELAFTDSKLALVEATKIKNDFGTYEEIKTTYESVEEKLTQWSSLGKFDQVKKCLELFADVIENGKNTKRKEAIKEMAEELKVSEEKIDKLYGPMTEEEIRDFFKDIKEEAQNMSTWSRKKSEGGNDSNDDSSTSHKDKLRLGRKLIESLVVEDKGEYNAEDGHSSKSSAPRKSLARSVSESLIVKERK